MTTPEQPGAGPAVTGETAPYLALPHIRMDSSRLSVVDRIADLGVAVVYFNDTSLQLHISAAADARALAGAFAKAAGMLEAADGDGDARGRGRRRGRVVMAARVEGHRWPPGRGGKYPWDEWLDGGTWELTPGEDFTVKASAFRAAAHAAAIRRGGTVRMRTADGSVILQFTPGSGAESPQVTS